MYRYTRADTSTSIPPSISLHLSARLILPSCLLCSFHHHTAFFLFQLSDGKDWHMCVPPGIVELITSQTYNSWRSSVSWQLAQSLFRLHAWKLLFLFVAVISHVCICYNLALFDVLWTWLMQKMTMKSYCGISSSILQEMRAEIRIGRSEVMQRGQRRQGPPCSQNTWFFSTGTMSMPWSCSTVRRWEGRAPRAVSLRVLLRSCRLWRGRSEASWSGSSLVWRRSRGKHYTELG